MNRQEQGSIDAEHRTVVVYTGPTSLDRTIGKNELYLRNFDYFLAHKGIDCSNHDTIITLSEETYDFYVQNDQRLKALIFECGNDAGHSDDGNSDDCNSDDGNNYSLKVIKRQDACYDLGSIHLVLSTYDLSNYYYFVYLNCGVVGPLWWDNDHHHHVQQSQQLPSLSWTAFLTSLLNDQIKMSGLSTNCHNRDGYQAHIQSMAFALDRIGLQIVKDSGAIYDCGMENEAMTLTDKVDLIGRYELGMSRAIFDKGYGISSWLWSRGRNTRSSKPKNASRSSGIWNTTRQIHEPVVLHGPDHWCHDVWYVDPFLRISSNYPRQFPSWNMTFFKTSRFIPPDVLSEVGYELTNDAMQNLVDLWYQGLATRFWPFQMVQSAFVE